MQQPVARGSQGCWLAALPALAAGLGGAAHMCRFHNACRLQGRDTSDSWPRTIPDANCQSPHYSGFAREGEGDMRFHCSSKRADVFKTKPTLSKSLRSICY